MTGSAAAPEALAFRRRPIVAGVRVRHMLGAEGVAVRVEGTQVVVAWGDDGEELILAGFLEAIADGLKV